MTLDLMAMKFNWSSTQMHKKLKSKPIEKPCLGLCSDDDPLIEQYLNHTVALGGGVKSVIVVAQGLFGEFTVYCNLSCSQKEAVLVAQTHQWKMA